MKLTSALLSLAALFSVASAVPTPTSTSVTSTSVTVRHNSIYDSATLDDVTCVDQDTDVSITDNVSVSSTKRDTSVSSSISIGGISPDSPFSCGTCLHVTFQEVEVYVTVVEDVSISTETSVLEVSSDVLTEFISVSQQETVDVETVTVEVEVVEVEQSFCV